METYEVIPINNFFDALEVRKIRNQCRSFMTNDTSAISYIKQLAWYLKAYRNENKNGESTCYLFKSNNNNSGFGYVRKIAGKYWITGGLSPDQRGKGLGKILFKRLIEQIPGESVWLEVLLSNSVARKLYNELGFREIKESDINGKKIVIMKLTKLS